MWLNETLASGMIPYYHFIGSEAGFGEDRRWQKVGTDYFRWTVEGESAAEKSLVETVRSLSYVFARVCHSRAFVEELRALAHDDTDIRNGTAGLEVGVMFGFVHEDRLDPERLSKYRALLLPNIAMLSGRQCQQIGDYVNSGGSIMASF